MGRDRIVGMMGVVWKLIVLDRNGNDSGGREMAV
jgi:hypothetical protein